MLKQAPSSEAGPNRWLAMVAFLAIAVVIIVIDLWTKAIAVEQLQTVGTSVPVIDGLLNFTLLYNRGAAFGFLAEAGGYQRWFFTIIAVVMSVVLTVWLYRTAATKRFESLGIALILAGAVGNLYDRITLGYVVDFIDFYFREWHFAAFNIADVGITCGAGILIFDAIFLTQKNNGSSDEPADKANG